MHASSDAVVSCWRLRQSLGTNQIFRYVELSARLENAALRMAGEHSRLSAGRMQRSGEFFDNAVNDHRKIPRPTHEMMPGYPARNAQI